MRWFSKKLLIYIPAFNCESSIIGVLKDIPTRIGGDADILVIDNCSTDETVANIQRARASGAIRNDVHIIQPATNIGYARSQKLAYSLACLSPSVQWVAMLHGDGQYPPALLTLLEPWLSTNAGLVYGYRSKWKYPGLEETPLNALVIIRLLSLLESLATGVHRREWHSGFVMHSTRFLKKVNFDALTNTPHIDGNLLFAAAAVDETAVAIPIYKRYKLLDRFEGAARRQYVIDVLRLMLEFRRRRQEYCRKPTFAEDPEEIVGTTFRTVG